MNVPVVSLNQVINGTTLKPGSAQFNVTVDEVLEPMAVLEALVMIPEDTRA